MKVVMEDLDQNLHEQAKENDLEESQEDKLQAKKEKTTKLLK